MSGSLLRASAHGFGAERGVEQHDGKTVDLLKASITTGLGHGRFERRRIWI
jgi:hypothetical protein